MQVTSIPKKRIKRRRVKPIKSPTHTHTQNTHNWWTQTCTHRRAHLTVIQCFARAQPKGRGEKESEKEKIITKFGNVPGDHISRNWPIGGGGCRVTLACESFPYYPLATDRRSRQNGIKFRQYQDHQLITQQSKSVAIAAARGEDSPLPSTEREFEIAVGKDITGSPNRLFQSRFFLFCL